MELKSKYVITLPRRPSLPILASDRISGQVKRITMQDAKNMVFGAVLRGDTVHAEDHNDPLIAAIIYIVDKDALAKARREFDTTLRAYGLLPLDVEVE